MFCFYHDSIGVGEDSPTHEPVEMVGQFVDAGASTIGQLT
jgi:transketolase